MQGLLFLHCSFTKGRKTHWAAACKRENVLEFCLAVDLNTKFMVMSAEWHRQKDSLPSTLLLFRRDLSNRILADLLCPEGAEKSNSAEKKEQFQPVMKEREGGRERGRAWERERINFIPKELQGKHKTSLIYTCLQRIWGEEMVGSGSLDEQGQIPWKHSNKNPFFLLFSLSRPEGKASGNQAY